jgi:hypothetical protein
MLKLSSIFLLLFITLGPIKTIVPFVQLTAGSEPATLRTAALRATHPSADGQWTCVHCPCSTGVVHRQWHRHGLHPPRITLGESIRGIV